MIFLSLNVRIVLRRKASAPMNTWATPSRYVDEFVGRNFGLAQDSRKRSDLDLVMHRHDTAFGAAPHDYVTAGLSNLYETEALTGFDDCRP